MELKWKFKINKLACLLLSRDNYFINSAGGMDLNFNWSEKDGGEIIQKDFRNKLRKNNFLYITQELVSKCMSVYIMWKDRY